MTFARSALLLAAAATCVQAVWEVNTGRIVGESVHLKIVHESVVYEDLDACKALALELERDTVLYNADSKLCVVFADSAAAKETEADKEGYTVAYHSEEEDEEDDSSLSDGEIAGTVILSIFYAICLVAIVFTCKNEELDIAGQMDNLEKRELELEEAVSEHYERKSEEFERKSHEAEAKEMAEVEKKDIQ